MMTTLMAIGYRLSAIGVWQLRITLNHKPIWLMATLLILLFSNIGCREEAPPPEALRLEIDTHTAQPLRHALHGFNTNMMSGDYGYLDTDFVDLTKALAPKTLRFPGGTVGNFYHWEASGFF